MKIKLELKIEDENIIDILVAALEGGSNYWYFLPDLSMVKEYHRRAMSEKIIMTVLEDESISIPVTDLEDEEELLGYINKQNIMEGIVLFIQNGNKFDPIMDAGDADALFQYIVMKEIVFG